ncbi:MAG: hypothetical protein AAB503_01215 [Patescibacteria group bacterium]
MGKLLSIIFSLWDEASVDFVDLTRKLAFVGKPNGRSVGHVYLISLLRLGIAFVVIPIVILLFEITIGKGWIVLIGRTLWVVCTVFLALAMFPIGVLVTALLGKPKDSVKKYVNLIGSVLLFELSFALFVIIIPIQNNPDAIPVFLLAAAIITLAGYSAKLVIGLVKTTAWLVLLVSLLSFFIPGPVAFVGMKLSEANGFLLDSMEGLFRKPNYITFAAYETVKPLKLHPTKWTGLVVIPNESKDHNFSVTDSTEIVFDNGDRFIMTPADKPNALINSHTGTFKIRGMGVVTITIIHKLSSVLETVAKPPVHSEKPEVVSTSIPTPVQISTPHPKQSELPWEPFQLRQNENNEVVRIGPGTVLRIITDKECHVWGARGAYEEQYGMQIKEGQEAEWANKRDAPEGFLRVQPDFGGITNIKIKRIR